jgi:hypothetical protein
MPACASGTAPVREAASNIALSNCLVPPAGRLCKCSSSAAWYSLGQPLASKRGCQPRSRGFDCLAGWRFGVMRRSARTARWSEPRSRSFVAFAVKTSKRLATRMKSILRCMPTVLWNVQVSSQGCWTRAFAMFKRCPAANSCRRAPLRPASSTVLKSPPTTIFKFARRSCVRAVRS